MPLVKLTSWQIHSSSSHARKPPVKWPSHSSQPIAPSPGIPRPNSHWRELHRLSETLVLRLPKRGSRESHVTPRCQRVLWLALTGDAGVAASPAELWQASRGLSRLVKPARSGRKLALCLGLGMNTMLESRRRPTADTGFGRTEISGPFVTAA